MVAESKSTSAPGRTIDIRDALVSLEARIEEGLAMQRRSEQLALEIFSGQEKIFDAISGLHTTCSTRGVGVTRHQSSTSSRNTSHNRRSADADGVGSAVTIQSQAVSEGVSAWGMNRVSISSDASIWASADVFSDGNNDQDQDQAKSTQSKMKALRTSRSLQLVPPSELSVEPVDADAMEVQEKLDHLLGEGPVSMRLTGRPLFKQSFDSGMHMLDPHGRFRVAHDLFSIGVLALDVVNAPVVLAWDLKIEGWLYALNVFSMIFWCFDMCLNFGTGYYVEDLLEVRPLMVAKRYAKTWLVPDTLIVAADAIALTLGGSNSSSSTGGEGSGALRVSKASRFVRIVRIGRLARVADAVARVAGANYFLEVAMEVMKPLVAIMVMTHMLACLWWSVSRSLPSDTGLRWTEVFLNDAELTYVDASWQYQYLTCIHWSLTQVTPGSMQVVPMNSYERAFNCACLLLGMVIFSTIISSLSAKMMQHYLRQRDMLTKLGAMRRFLKQRVPASLTLAAHAQAERAMMGGPSKPVLVSDVFAIFLLPMAMQRRIKVELCTRHLQHPLMRWWQIMDPEGMRGLCHSAIEFIALSAEDHLFFPRTDAAGAYVLTIGVAAYLQSSDRKGGQEINQGAFFCEAALWSKWKHVGELIAKTGCELLTFSCAELAKCFDEHGVIKHVVMQYGRSFYRRLTSVLLPEDEPPNDITVALSEFDCILPSLSVECRQLIGAAAMHTFVNTRTKHDPAFLDEVREGRCCLLVNWAGEVERVVPIIVLRLLKQDTMRVLVQLGTWNGSAAEASCILPGKKQREGETTAETYDRLLQGAMAPFARHIICKGSELEVEWKKSQRREVTTKYMKTVYHADLSELADASWMDSLRVNLVNQSITPAVASRPISKTSSACFSQSPLVLLDVYALADEDGKISLMGWITEDEFIFYRSYEGERQLQCMFEQVCLDNGMVERTRVGVLGGVAREVL